jgi:phage virion morphogenesis protein
MQGLSSRFNAGAITRHLAGLQLLTAHGFKAARREIGEYMLAEVQDNLDRQKLFDGSAMPQSKAAIKRAGKTLINTHRLYDSYVYQLIDEGVQIGSALKYARIHHFGGMTGRGHHTKILPRPVLGVGPRQERRIGDILVEQIGAVP